MGVGDGPPIILAKRGLGDAQPGVYMDLLNGSLPICPGLCSLAPAGGLLGHHLILFPWSSLAVSELLEQTGHTRAGEPLADLHPRVQPEGGGHHAAAPG